MRKYDYHLSDDGGVSTEWNQPFLMPLETQFLHEFGLYKVEQYLDKDGNPTKVTDRIKSVMCERTKTNQELKTGK